MLRRIAAFVLAGLVLVPAAAAARMTRSETALLREMNRVRTAQHLAPLRFDGSLEQAARTHSREMLQSGTFAHGAFASRMLRFRVTGSLAGENLAWGVGFQATPRGIVQAWLASPAH